MFKVLFKRVSRIPCKVESTAKLMGCSGSEAARTKTADDLCSKFSQKIRDTFELQEKKGEPTALSQENLQSYFKELAPNVDLNVVAITQRNGYSGSVVPLLTETGESVRGYSLEIPFDYGSYIKKEDASKLDILSHEARHFFNFITEPKYRARAILNDFPEGKKSAAWNFYEKVLYNEETNALPGRDFVTRLRAHLVEDKKARLDGVKAKMNAFFVKNSCSADEQIQLLQKWRYGLKTEIAAYTNQYTNGISKGIALNNSMQKLTKGQDVKFEYHDEIGKNIFVDTANESSLEEKISVVKIALDKKGKAACSSTVHQQGFLPEKLKLVEKTLAEEISSVRAEQKNLLEKINYNK
jgi:hypothetical protein